MGEIVIVYNYKNLYKPRDTIKFMSGKKGVYAWISGLLLINILPFINAYSFALNDIISRGPRDLIDIIKNFTSPFFEALLNTSAYSEFFFAKVLLLILVFICIYFVLRKIDFLGLNEKKGILIIIASVISILGLRYLPENDLIKGVLLPYNTLGLAIAIFLPFLIYFFFVEKSIPSPPGRRAAWIIYAVIFGVLWVSRRSEISEIANYIYLAGLIVVILCLFFDDSLHKYFKLDDLRKLERGISVSNRIDLLAKLRKAEEIQAAYPDDKEIKEHIKNLKKALRMNVESGSNILGEGI
jgi:drug/metabolite transporter (DMT)-like permease